LRIKSLLAGCVGSLIALSGAQAASPVEYVKVCSLYGAGFYYIPGTDMCLKVGGYVRTQAEYQSINGLSLGSTNGVNTPTTTNGGTWGPSTIDDGSFNRRTNSIYYGMRGVINADARNQTEYGTVRSYISVGIGTNSNISSAANQFFVERAFIQFAGFTAGLTRSYFDIFSNTEVYSYTNAKTSADTQIYGIPVFAYTAQFGNGMSATISAEVPHYQGGVGDGNPGVFGTNGTVTTDTAGTKVPDFIGNLRIDQAWGYAAISGAVHQVAGGYYGSGTVEGNGHPSDKYGWAGQVGGMVMLPWNSTFGASFVGSKGATGYATKAGSWQMYNGNSVGVGWVVDGLFDNTGLFPNSQISLTNAWSANAGVEHKWNQQWKTSLYGGYTRIWYDNDAINLINQHLPTPTVGGISCGVPVEGSIWPPISPGTNGTGVGNSCSPNFSFWQAGSRTQWNISPATYMGLDVTYTRLNTAYKGIGVYPASTSHSAITGGLDDQSVWSGIFRVQHTFGP
jgi:hypothetical protein